VLGVTPRTARVSNCDAVVTASSNDVQCVAHYRCRYVSANYQSWNGGGRRGRRPCFRVGLSGTNADRGARREKPSPIPWPGAGPQGSETPSQIRGMQGQRSPTKLATRLLNQKGPEPAVRGLSYFRARGRFTQPCLKPPCRSRPSACQRHRRRIRPCRQAKARRRRTACPS